MAMFIILVVLFNVCVILGQEFCPAGSPLPDVFCGRGPTRQECPTGYFCNIDPADRFAVCCPQNSDVSCSYSGTTYRNGESFKALDGCNTCHCGQGTISCTLMFCLLG